MQPRSNTGDNKPPKKYYSARKKFCAFCKDKVTLIDYKNHKFLENFISETGRISPASATCAAPDSCPRPSSGPADGLIRFTEKKRIS
jgi:ribosomal protein S18